MKPRQDPPVHLTRRQRDKLFSQLSITPSGCLLWSGTGAPGGYGRIWITDRHVLVHRLMWELFGGAVPVDLELDHLCRVRNCASLAHLEPVPHRENVLRSSSFIAVNAAQTHCGKGHLLDEANTLVSRGRRNCRACHNAACRRYVARKARLALGEHEEVA